jgi:hypothetical protein
MTYPSPSPAPTAAAAQAQSDLSNLLAANGITIGAPASSSAGNLPVPTRTPLDESRTLFESGGFSDARDSYYAAQGAPSGIALRPQSAAYLDVMRMSDDDLLALGKRLVDAGLLRSNWTRDDIEAAWTKLVDKAAQRHQANPNSDLTPEDMIDLYGGNGTLSSGPNVSTVVTKDVQISDANTARSLLENMLTDALGRAPTGKEADDFQSALNEAQTKNPAITSTSTSYDAAGNETGRTNTSSGGVDTGAFTQQYRDTSVDNTKEYASYQAATTHSNALVQAIKGPFG